VIEQRGAEEVTSLAGVQTGPQGVQVYNPAFDVTPHGLLSGIITEKGVLLPPFREKLVTLLG
jgi:methylthioribose-1-phosphate isomerase